MPGVKYEQLSTKGEVDEDVATAKPRKKWSEAWCQKGLLSLGLILLYFSLSIGLTFYQRWLLKDFRYPLSVVMYHLVVKWVLAVVVRWARRLWTGQPQLLLPFMTCLRSVAPTGLASGIDVGFSNWGLELVTISLYTMTKSSTIIFILGFAILFGLERKSWSLAGVVLAIAVGLAMFTYKASMFSWRGFCLLCVASCAGGLRWAGAQLLLQRARLGLHDPVHMLLHVQPWMLGALLPFAALFEGLSCVEYLRALPGGALAPTLARVSGGAALAFLMELSEFLVVAHTSSLTLSIAGIFKEICILALAVAVSGDRLSAINAAGLAVCLLGIIGHVVHKALLIKSMTGGMPLDEGFAPAPLPHPRSRTPKAGGGGAEPLLEPRWTLPSDDSDVDASRVLCEVLQRRERDRDHRWMGELSTCTYGEAEGPRVTDHLRFG